MDSASLPHALDAPQLGEPAITPSGWPLLSPATSRIEEVPRCHYLMAYQRVFARQKNIAVFHRDLCECPGTMDPPSIAVLSVIPVFSVRRGIFTHAWINRGSYRNPHYLYISLRY